MIQIETIETASLGDRSYLAHYGQLAVVIDPQRDIDRVLGLVAERRLQVTHVLETHVHNDYVTGGLELSRRTGAVRAGHRQRRRLRPRGGSGRAAAAGGTTRLRVLHTPGHTHSHVSYVLETADGDVRAVFTGGSMLYGATGRTDLLGPADTQQLTHAQFHSVRRLASELPAETEVSPRTGSAASARPPRPAAPPPRSGNSRGSTPP
jgi:hydroxyacylglutathione hydrolase